jgi:MFS family permease
MFDQSASEESSHHKWFVLIIILMAPFMAYLDLYIGFVASPSIQHGLHTNFEQIQFVIAGYTIAYGINLITAGRLGDTYGRKRMFMIGMAVFTLTSAGCAFAPNSSTLIIIRIFQGAAAAIMFPQTLAIIQATFTSKQKDIAIAWYGVIIGIGAVAGQLLGGFLVQTNLFNLDWRLIFLVNVPMGIGTLIAALRIVHESKSEKSVGLDIGGTAIISVILFLLFYPLIEGRDAGWPLWMYISIILSIVLIVPFIFFERRLTSSSKHNGSGNINSKTDKRSQSTFKPKLPLIPLSLFKDRSFMIGTLIMLVFYIGNFVFVFVLTFYLQNGLGFSPLASGLIYLPMGIGFLISSLLTPQIVPKLETGILKIGTIIMIVGYGLVVLTAHQESSIGLQSSQLLPYMFTIGIGLGFVVVPLINIIISRAKVENVGAASGVLNTMMAVGNAMGIALIGSLFFGMIAVNATSAASDIGTHSNGSTNHFKIHHYTYALINSILCSIGVVIVTFLLIFLLPSMRHNKLSSEQKNHGSVST